VAEGKILKDAISIGGIHHGGFAQSASALGAFGLAKMASASAAAQDFAGASNFEPLRGGLLRLDTFGTSHIKIFVSFRKKSEQYR
jgi:hypothetical protein